MSVSDCDILHFAHEMVYKTSPPLHADDRFLKWTLFPAWRDGTFASVEESRLCGEYGTWSRLREFQKRFPHVPLRRLFDMLQRVAAMQSMACSLVDQAAAPEQCVAEINALFPEVPEALRHKSVDDAYSRAYW